MYLVTHALILLFGIYFCNAGYGIPAPSGSQQTQSDVQAPAYVPSYLKNQRFSKTGYSRGPGLKTGYSGTKTGYTGTKTGYTGTKTGYTGTKTGTKTSYAGTKTAGTKTAYAGTKNVQPSKTGYSQSKTWSSSYGAAPSYQEFHSKANEAYTAKCEPDCKNNGICVDTNTCHCPVNYYGKYCEFEKKPCLTYPPLPMNSRRKCSSDLCTITCMEGHKFIDGSTVANMRCVDGQWQPTRADFSSIPDCEPECNPPCANGGVCLALNTCQCPADYRGPQCQYAATVCDVRKLAFNGGYNCFGDSEKFSCKLNCPSGATYSSAPAEVYTCLYSAGQFEPQPIPHCVFNEVVVITPSNGHSEYSSSSQFYETHYENHTSESYGFGYESENSSGRGDIDIELLGGSDRGKGGHGQGHADTEYDQSQIHAGFGQSQTEYGEPTYGHKNYGGNEKPVKIVVQDFTPKGGTCLSWAGVHYKTFDGKIYSFQSSCQHILVRDAKEHKYTVAIRQGDCKRQSYCPTELTIYLEDKPYVLSVGEDGSVVFRSTKRLIPIPASLPGIRVAMPSDYVVVNLDALGVTIKWDTNNLVLVEGTLLLWNNTEGLCGRLDGNPVNDLTTKEGKIAKTKSVLASSWQLNKIGDICDSNPTETSACASKSDEDMKKALQFCTKIFSKDKFRKCSKAMDVSLLLEACQWDYCACTTSLSPEECACSTVSVYAKECLRHGVEEMKNWRDADTCPMKCPEGKLYQSCGPDAQPSCAFPLLSTKADNSTCVEGCFCPEGLLLEGGRCVPKENCPCRLRNKSFPPGSVVPKDCNTCTCQSGEWTCTQVPCGARCGAVGDPHYTTFDGLRYDFMGHCTYNLLKTDNLTVEVENVACSGTITEAMNLAPYKGAGKPSCTKAVNLIYEGINVHLKQGGFILVNGKEVASLPVHIGDVLIRAASSLFVILQLPNGVDLWWDGNTRVFVDVPPEFAGKTKGLCGTFNLNQKDDFLTPEGDVEQSALAFANKWKTREFCDDVETKEPEHPCKANVENKETAEKYCTKLKSKLFQACHWHVDVEPYYEECVYDMCACAGDAARCLCPILGDYAMACAKAGVKIQWRYNVKECELSCSGGQEYTVCADSCQRTCSDVALSATGHCKPVCVEGCACAPGQVLDNSGVCVPIGLCPCYHKGMQFDAGYKEVRAGKRERELCTCVGARWDCKPATPDEVQNYPPAEDMRNNCSAALHMEFTTCEIAEPLTCKNMHLPPSSTTAECRPGCQCKKGYVLDTTSKKCVLATQCPCHHGGRSYPDGYVMQEECNKCECKSGNWTCSQRKCAGVCGAWGDSHITTFDGADYDFEGVCTYLLAKGVLDANDGFDVEIQNVPCGTTGATCSKSLTLKVGTGNNEEIVSLTKNAPIPDFSKLKRIKLRIAGSYVFLDVPSLGMSVQWDRGMRVYVKVDAMWQNRVKGLCGNYNADLRDDFQTPSGGGIAETSALLFADSWKLKPTCPKPQPVKDHCQQRPERKEWATSACGALKRYPFTLCHTEVPPTAFIERCEKDACACDSGEDCECACTALAAYAQRCSARGVVFKWRSQERCPMQCDEECSNYDACVSACPLETCDNIHYYEETRPLCEHDTCVEGCKPKKSCPEGSVYNNRSYTECVPIAKCKPVCLTLPDGREVLEGEVIEEDACHTCRCSKKQKICTGIPCTSSAPLKSSEATTVTPKPEKPHDEPLKCVTGWTNWISRDSPTPELNAESVDNEPLPKINELPIGSPTCKQEKMKKIECRTIIGHKTPKETGLNVECSLERGLVCRESGANVCPDFEIRVYCECEEEPFQCLNSDHPNYPHPTDCSKFYECTPDMENPSKPHTVLKSCAEGLMYNPTLMICDWPAAVIATRPECGNRTEEITKTETPIPVSTVTSATVTLPSTVTPIVPEACPPGQVYSDCAYPCDKLCDHFKRTLQDKGKCFVGLGDKCVKGCVDKIVAETDCSKGRWRDETTCVPEKDCTCYDKGNIVKPGGVVVDGCVKCQCLDNDLHCDVSECETTFSPIRTPSHSTEPPIFIVSTEQAHTPSFSPPILLSTVTPPPECSPDNYINLLESVPDTAFSASSVAGPLFEPPYASLHRPSKNITGGSWNPSVTDQNQYIQVELPRKEPIYGVVTEGNPIFNEYVSSYEIMYGDDGSSYTTVNEPDGKPKVFKGPESHKIPSKQMIEPPILARFIRLRPLTWHEGIAVQFELIGCQVPLSTTVTTVKTTTTITPTPSTVAPIIVKSTVSPPPECNPDSYINLLENREIPDVAYSASSVAGPLFLPPYASLYRPSKNLTGGTWNPTTIDQNQYIQVELPQREPIYGVVVEGSPIFDEYVTSYEIMYGDDGNIFSTVNGPDGTPKVFRGPADNKVPVKQMIEPPIEARYVRLHPLTWHEGIAVQFELIGCQEPLSTITTETTLTTESLQCTEPLGLAAELPVESIEVSSNNDARQYFALDSARGWRPAYSTPGEWIMFDFQSPRNITGIKTKGGPKGWVTSYNIMYTSDLSTFNPVVDSAGKRVVFPGNFDRDSVVTNEFHPPIHARYFKVLPLKWQDNIEMRVEPIGCFEPYSTTPSPTKGTTPTSTKEPMQCTEPLGLAAELPVESIEVSSNNDARQYFALEGARGWRPTHSTPGEWIMFDFQSPRNITGIKTKGGPKGWVTSYNIMYTSDLNTFNPVVDSMGKQVVFPGNFDRDSVVMNEFHPPIHARYFKVLPLKWQDNIEMRVEPIGCFEPYSVTERTPTVLLGDWIGTQSTVTPCKPCPGIRASGCMCATPEAPYFDGENCVPRDQCPCVESFMTYAVGSTFRGSECDECVCKLGGVTICKPVKECKCAPNLVPKLVSSSCECFCEPCPPDTKICPTSKLCLPLEKWCDGLQDCPDDERECSTAITPIIITTVSIEPTFVTKAPPTAGSQFTVGPTVKPLECPKVDCPPGYMIRYITTSSSSYSRSSTSELPPPRPRVSYQRYRKGGAAKGGGYAKGGYSKTGYSKTGYSKGGYSKGGYSGAPTQPQSNQAFSLDKPSINNNMHTIVTKQECAQFKCIPKLPAIPRPGSTPAPVVCSAPTCPPQYSLKLESVPTEANKCPQYVCVPPPERPVFCNVTGRTINTFDGTEYKYDVCFHILARENRFDAWTVLVRKKCRVDGCQNELLVRQDDQLILVKPNLMIEYDNYEYNVEQTSMICFQKNSFDIGRLGNGLAIKSRKYNFTVLYTTDGDIKIGVSKSLMGTVDGLCGAFDGVPSNDRRRPDGVLAASIDEFGRSWAKPGLPPDACRTKVIDAQKQKRVWDLCDAITKEPISQCAKVLNLDKWRSICLEKICECADLVVNGTKRTEEECRCLLVEKLVAECLAADKDLDVASWRMQLDCPAECPPPLVHYDCYRKRCEPTCGGSGAARSCPADEGHCFPGCYCPEGKLRKGDLCVAPPDCLDCVCNGVGTPSKFVTFERDDLPYGGNCTYLASRDRNETGQHKYEVYITNGPCAGNNGIVCTNIVHLIYEKNVIHVTKDPITKKLQTTISDSPVFKYPLKKDWVIISLVNGQDISIVLPDVHVELTVQQSKMDFAVRVPSHLYANQTEGLCGVCAGYQEHLVTSNGTITDDIEEYGKSWQATPEALTTLDVPPQEQCDEIPPEEEECIPPQADQNPCYNLYNEEKFGACHPLVDPEEYVHMCEEELCALNSSDVCDVLERYAAECRQEGVCLDWRSDLCPHPCAEPLVYRPCVDCERTCDNDEELKKNPKECDKRPVEGCFCPEGKVRVNNTCIEPTKCFPCDAKKEHYAGDEWQEDACTKCSCSKLSEENRAHVSCTTQTCSTPVCSEEEDTIAKPKRPGACCTEYICVPKPQDNPQCDEPKKMECGFGQVLKQKTKANGCKEFACECKPASECEHIPTESEVDILEPGMERLVDNSGCCPRVQLLCRKETCPGEPECPRFHVLETKNNTGKCCPEYSCELPKDKCVVTLEWEAASKGGEKSRKNPQVMLKDVDSAWLDGPCRSCRCEASPLGAVPRCSVTECNPVTSTEQFVLEPRPVPFACCPRPVQVACRDGDNIYKVGENWTSPYDVCESYECVEVGDGKLERITTLQTCHEDCQPGWKYFPADRNTKQCCGKCKPVACVVNGEEHKIGDRWTSPDHCTNYTCVDLDGTLQVQSSDEVCSEPSTALKKQFVLKENKVPSVCCSTHEPVACRVGNKVYQEGQTWPSPDPCRNVTCARDDTGRLTKTESVETCVKECKRGWKYVEAEAGVCCGHCVQDACVVDDELRKPGTTWQSADNCTTYSCEGSADGVYVTSARESCPDISACKPEDIVNDTCCQICVEKPSSLSTCVPERVENAEVVGLIRIRLGAHGVCVNKQPLNQLKECRGTCGSGTVYNNQTGSHDSNCECCQAVKYEPIVVELSCDDGTLQQHRVASPAQCKCQKCGGGSTWPTKTGYSGTKNPPRKGGYAEYEIPSMYARFGESTAIPTR